MFANRSSAYKALTMTSGREISRETRESSKESIMPPAREPTLYDVSEVLTELQMLPPIENVPERPPFHGVDIVQFSAFIYYVDSVEGFLMIDIMRIGSMRGEVRVQYETEDASARAGVRYTKSSGEVVFADGVSNVAIKIDIMPNPIWAATMEFGVNLSNPSPNCEVGIYLSHCRVKLMDSHYFPSDRCRNALEGTKPDRSVSGLRLFWEFVKFNFRVEGIAWRTLITLLFDQLENLTSFAMLTLNVYLVDVVVNYKDPSSESKLWLPSRQMTGVLVGALHVAPPFLSHCWGYARMKLRTAPLTRAFLQKSLYRKYMNITEASRAQISSGDIALGILTHAPELAESYMQVLMVAKEVGKFVMLNAFMLVHNRNAWWSLLLMPTLMVVYCVGYLWNFDAVVHARYQQATRVASTVTETEKHYELIADCLQRPQMNTKFAEEVTHLNQCIGTEARWVLHFNIFPQYLGAFFAGFWIAWKVPLVLSGQESLGTLLAMVTVFSKVAADFGNIYCEWLVLKKRLTSLENLAYIYNRPTDLPSNKRGNRTRRELTKSALERALKKADSSQLKCPVTDTLQLQLREVSYKFDGQKPLLCNVLVSAHQSSLIAVVAEHGMGRQTLMRLISLRLTPDTGIVLIPTHLRTLHVSQEPHLLAGSAWYNLTFASPDATEERVLNVVERLDMKYVLQVLEEHLGRNGAAKSDKALDAAATKPQASQAGKEFERAKAWQARLTESERAKVHLARAIIMNPEVMVLQRPFRQYTERTSVEVMKIIKEHVKCRGVAMPDTTVGRRRPRTVFYTAETMHQAEQADAIWHIDQARRTVVATPGGNSLIDV